VVRAERPGGGLMIACSIARKRKAMELITDESLYAYETFNS
jgi:hypothetical protein